MGHIHGMDFLANIVKQLNTINPEMVVITGDLFDGMDGKLTSLLRPLNDLTPPSGIYFVTGNHETLIGSDKVIEALQSTNITVLNNKCITLHGLQLVGIGYPPWGERTDIRTIIGSINYFDKNQPSILLYHEPKYIDQAKEMGIHLMLSGHTHKGQLFPFGFITSLVYGGHDYGLYTDGDFSQYTSSGIGTWGPPMRTGNAPEIVVITLQ